jgi:hypothetical protein
MIATSARRVQRHTAQWINDRLERQLQINVEYYRAHPQEINQRLAELDQEWDIERALETGSSVLSLLGLTMALSSGRKWLALPLAVQSFFLQHGLQGWCPPIPLFRRMGLRTQNEIERERYALKAIRGDFDGLADIQDGSVILGALER